MFFDDILVYSPSHEAHLDHLKIVLEVLRTHTLKVNFKKCCFGMLQLEYLGHIISAEGVAADPNKVKKMVD